MPVAQQHSAALKNHSDLYRHLLEKLKNYAAPISEVPGDGKHTHLEWHPGDRVLLLTEDSGRPLAPAVHIYLLGHHSSVVSHAIGRVPVEFWDLDF